MEPVEVLEFGPVTAEIFQDEDPRNPRTDYDNFGTMVCFHGRYDLGDKHDIRLEDIGGGEALDEYLRKKLHAVVILPLYLYDHSGITIRTSSFSCPWDSGQVGFIYVSREKAVEEFGNLTKAKFKKIEALLESEVETYDQYLCGDVYGYVLKDYGKEVESCWGFYGLDYIREEVARLASDLNKHEEAKTLFGKGV